MDLMKLLALAGAAFVGYRVVSGLPIVPDIGSDLADDATDQPPPAAVVYCPDGTVKSATAACPPAAPPPPANVPPPAPPVLVLPVSQTDGHALRGWGDEQMSALNRPLNVYEWRYGFRELYGAEAPDIASPGEEKLSFQQFWNQTRSALEI